MIMKVMFEIFLAGDSSRTALSSLLQLLCSVSSFRDGCIEGPTCSARMSKLDRVNTILKGVSSRISAQSEHLVRFMFRQSNAMNGKFLELSVQHKTSKAGRA